MYIYKITNNITKKSYIGKYKGNSPYYMGSGLLIWQSYRKRFNRQDIKGNKSDHKWVYQENEKYHYYTKTILATCDNDKELCELEKYYIKYYNTIRPNGYNIAEGGEGGCLIAGLTEEEKDEWKQKISVTVKEAMQHPEVKEKFLNAVQNKDEQWRKNISKALTGHKGHPMSDENKEKLRQRNMGNKYGLGNKSRIGMKNSPEMNRHISEGAKKVTHTKEWNEKVSKALKGKPKSEEHKQNLRKPKPKYKWLLPDGTYKIMDASNGSRHKDWIKLEKVM